MRLRVDSLAAGTVRKVIESKLIACSFPEPAR